MAMLITRFHKLIQSKVVWYIILGVIVISFVGFFTPTMRDSSRQQKESPAGELFGKKVSRDEYRRAFYYTRIWYIISTGRMVPDEMNAELRDEAWRRVAVLRKAQAEKIIVTDDEVKQQIQMVPLFRAQNGAFDLNACKSVLKQLDITWEQTKELFREQIAMYKLMNRPMQAALVAPSDLDRSYHLYTDRFVVNYAVLPRAEIEKSVSVSKEEAKALFDTNPAAFVMPVKVRVSYVEFPVSNFMAQAAVPEGAARQLYDQNLEYFRIETTNATAAAQYKTFEEAEPEITARIKQAAALKLAYGKASEFVGDVTPKSDSAKPDFAGAAAAAGLKVKPLPAFSAKEELKGIDPAAPFHQAAFSLENDAYSSFSDPVVGKDTVYVLSLEQRYPAFVPEYGAVEKEVMAAARKQAVDQALAARALEINGAVSAALAKGVDFATALKPFALKMKTTPEFDVTTELKDDYAQALLQGCLNVPQGKLCAPAPVKEGVLLAHVAKRSSVDAAVGLPAIRDELVDGLARTLAQRLTASWQESLLVEGHFKDMLSKSAE